MCTETIIGRATSHSPLRSRLITYVYVCKSRVSQARGIGGLTCEKVAVSRYLSSG